MHVDKLEDEDGRLAALNRYCILDTGPELVFEKITTLVKSVLDVPICAVSLIDRDRQWFKAIQGLTVSETTREVAFCHHTIQRRQAMIVEDAALDPRFANNALVTGPPHIRSYAGVPLETPEGYNLGALCAIDRKPRHYTSDQIAVLQQFADLVITELEIRSAALQDRLTGLPLREALIETMQAQLQTFENRGRHCSLILLDIDHFSEINTRHGREAGDLLLQRLAGCVRHSTRPEDIIVRFEGDTLAVVLPGWTAYEAIACAERLRSRAAQLRLPSAPDLLPTISCGVAALQRGVSQELWLAAAEGALFSAKDGGRNRCVSADKLW